MFLVRKSNPLVQNALCRRFKLSASHVFERHKFVLGAAFRGTARVFGTTKTRILAVFLQIKQFPGARFLDCAEYVEKGTFTTRYVFFLFFFNAIFFPLPRPPLLFLFIRCSSREYFLFLRDSLLRLGFFIRRLCLCDLLTVIFHSFHFSPQKCEVSTKYGGC